VYKKGQKVVILVDNASGAIVKKGDVFTITSVSGGRIFTTKTSGSGSWQFHPAEVALFLETIEDIEKGIKHCEEELADLHDRKQWMQENKIKDFDPEVFKVWRVLKSMRDGKEKSEIQLAEEIATIINK
jgi:hypothetical protein